VGIVIQERRFDFTDKDLQEIFARSEAADVVGINAFEDKFLARVEGGGNLTGFTLPWVDTHHLVRMHTGAVSLWCGINGHKKSTCISQVALHVARHATVGIASFEMKLEDQAFMMCKQAAGSDRISHAYARRFYDWVQDKVCWYRALGGVKPLEALGAIAAMADRGCKFIVLDNLQFCGVTDDIERERLFCNQLIGMAEAKDVHIAVVHHVRKPQSGGDEYLPTRFDVRGGGTIVDQAHMLFICWHNKRRARLAEAAEMGMPLNEKETKLLEEPGFKLVVAKQRHAPFEGTFKLWEDGGQTFKKRPDGRTVLVEEV
jgi:twinkle protein